MTNYAKTLQILLKENDIILTQSYKEWYYIQIQNTLHRNILFCEEFDIFFRDIMLNYKTYRKNIKNSDFIIILYI